MYTGIFVRYVGYINAIGPSPCHVHVARHNRRDMYHQDVTFNYKGRIHVICLILVVL